MPHPLEDAPPAVWCGSHGFDAGEHIVGGQIAAEEGEHGRGSPRTAPGLRRYFQ
jgi:hypothetical protein